MHDNLTIRMATEADAAELLTIYTPYVTDTAITFEYVVPSLEEFTERIQKTLRKHPYLIAVSEETVLGYAYASAFKERAAYDWSVETTVYVKQKCQGMGIGKKLYFALEDSLKQQHITNMNACITYPNPGSIGFHEKMGFKTVGHFTKCGYKFGEWFDMIWMEKIIGEHPANPQPVILITQL